MEAAMPEGRHMFVRIPFQSSRLSGGGLGVRTVLNASGLYVASHDPRAAQWYFEYLVQVFVLEKGFLKPREGEHIEPEKWIDWKALKRSYRGNGMIKIRIVPGAVKTSLASRPPKKMLCLTSWNLTTGDVVVQAEDPVLREDAARWFEKAFSEDMDRD